MSFRHRLMFFLSQFETDCKACLRRWNCAECRNRDAVPLLDALRRHDGSRPQRPPEDNSLGARVKSVLAQIRGSAAPLRAKDIRLNCSKSLKEWTLRSMIKRGTICRRPRTEYDYEYYIPDFDSHRNNHPMENRHERRRERGPEQRPDCPSSGDTEGAGGNAAAEEEQHGGSPQQDRAGL